MKNLTYRKDKNRNKFDEIHCRSCESKTKQKLLTNIEESGFADSNEHVSFYNCYQIAQCQGCATITFRKTHQNSEEEIPYQTPNGVEFVPVTYETLYPNPDYGRPPLDEIEIHLSPKLLKIYNETIKALNLRLPVLCSIGIRAIVETICKNKNALGSNLYRKIDDLVTKQVLTPNGASILHKLRVMGNDAAHEVKPHTIEQLNLALDVIENLISSVYILPSKSDSVFN